jgi:hypothetical protein
MAANIACVICGARPFPELALPAIVREEFDLLKLVQRQGKDEDGEKITYWAPAGENESQWFCPLHRPGK